MATLAPSIIPTPYSAYVHDGHRPSYRSSSRDIHNIVHATRRPATEIPPKSSTILPTENDSSDDEELAPIKLSAEAQAILGEDNSRAEAEQVNAQPSLDDGNDLRTGSEKQNRRSWIAELYPSASAERNGSPPLRSSRHFSSRPSPPRTLARDGSFMYKIHEKTLPAIETQASTTPAQPLRRIRVSGSRSNTRSPPLSSEDIRSSPSHGEKSNGPERIASATRDNEGHDPQYPSTVSRTRRLDEGGIHSTMRVRRIGTGTLLSGPVRRGVIRRQSVEDKEQMNSAAEQEDSPEIQYGRRAKEADLIDLPDERLIPLDSPLMAAKKSLEKQSLSIDNKPQPSPHQYNSNAILSVEQKDVLSVSISKTKTMPNSGGLADSSRPLSSNQKAVFRIPALPPLESRRDQENETPPTFKRNKPSASVLQVHEDDPMGPSDLKVDSLPKQHLNGQRSPSRHPLSARSNNTPHRPAPVPPPKMSLIDAATSAGANARSKKSVHYVLNGRTYRRLDCIGRGGSSRVFRIMAENYKIFALKRVNLEEADMAAIAGFKGEIDLLKKLENVDRVVRLFDYEVNEEKGVLSVMMELGESDFNKMLNEQLKGENARLDITFTRHYWKEMLECVKSVHSHEIVHSDLKPANFLLVKGQLKLIDFGIAGAIQDNTVNVHRENQIGTPNYMSPESLVCQTPAIGQAAGTKLLKLGKPSDVWSLGCILYQMTYGQPPFAHITKQFERIMSIPNPKVEIQFPGTGIGGAVVPFGLIKTLRRCLQRDQTLRPTIEELLSESDPFLHPVAISTEMLGRVIGNVVGYCRKREEKLREDGKMQIQEGCSVLPKDEEMRGWPGAFYDKLREAGREGTAW